jgi:hypothetical protein
MIGLSGSLVAINLRGMHIGSQKDELTRLLPDHSEHKYQKAMLKLAISVVESDAWT